MRPSESDEEYETSIPGMLPFQSAVMRPSESDTRPFLWKENERFNPLSCGQVNQTPHYDSGVVLALFQSAVMRPSESDFPSLSTFGLPKSFNPLSCGQVNQTLDSPT